MSREMVKFKGKLNSSCPQMYPKYNAPYEDGEYAILNVDVIESIEGDVKLNRYGNVTIKGNFPHISNGNKHYIVVGQLCEESTWGFQYDSMIREDISLDDVSQQKIFLKAFLKESQIENLYSALKDPINTIKEQDVESMCMVKGIGESTANKIIDKYYENIEYAEAFVELHSFGLTYNAIKKLVDEYKSPTVLISKIKKNPYILADEVKGVGFVKADNMALCNGMDRLSPLRLEAFIIYKLEEGAQQGYSWISSSNLVDIIEQDLDSFELDSVITSVNNLKSKKILWEGEKGKIALNKYYKLEEKIALELIRIRDSEPSFEFIDWEKRVKVAENLQGWEYTEQQNEAIGEVIKNQLQLITGGSGCGKTSTALGAIKALGEINFKQCALAGKAAARMQEATGYEAYTIHRLLGFNPSNESPFEYNRDNQLDIDAVVVDEVGMIGGYLFLSLLEAIPNGCKLILLGDMGQLPSIGALNIGADLTYSEEVPTVTLTQIHRQAKKSAIIVDSRNIRNGEQITEQGWNGKTKRGELQDLELDIHGDSSTTPEKCAEHFKEKMKMSANDIMEVQIIVPMNIRGMSSVYALNNLIQPIYNPKSHEKAEVTLPIAKDKFYTLRVGDKVINTKNNYKMPVAENHEFGGWQKVLIGIDKFKEVKVFNGFIGEIVEIENNNLIVHFNLIDETVLIPSSHWKTKKGIELAYALTCHKLQGSNIKYPICAIDYSHYRMLSREWVYTAITRASRHCTLIAEHRALRYAISQTAVEEKQTFLRDLLSKHAH